MTGYIAGLTCLALVLSPLFIPLAVTVVHWVRNLAQYPARHQTGCRNTTPRAGTESDTTRRAGMSGRTARRAASSAAGCADALRPTCLLRR